MKPNRNTAVIQGLLLVCVFLQMSSARADDHGNDPSTATPISPGTVTPGVIETSGDIDYFRLSVTKSGWYYITTRGTTDTYGQLYDSVLNLLASDNDSGEANNFRIVWQLTPGTYYIRVAANFTSTTGAYQLHVEGPGTGTVSDDH